MNETSLRDQSTTLPKGFLQELFYLSHQVDTCGFQPVEEEQFLRLWSNFVELAEYHGYHLPSKPPFTLEEQIEFFES